MNWIIKKIKRCVCCMLILSFVAAMIASNYYTYRAAKELAYDEVCGDLSYYNSIDRDLVKVKQCEGR